MKSKPALIALFAGSLTVGCQVGPEVRFAPVSPLKHVSTPVSPRTVSLPPAPSMPEASPRAMTQFANRMPPGGEPLSSVEVLRTYDSPESGPVDLLGACKATPEAIACWDPDGKLDPDLSEKIKAYYIVNSSTELHTKFRRKNRLVVFKRSSKAINNINLDYSQNGGMRNVVQAGQLGSFGLGDEPYYEWYAVDADLSQRSTSIAFRLNLPFGTVAIPLKEGAEGKVGQLHIKIAGIKPGPLVERRIPRQIVKQPSWTISVDLSGFPGPVLPDLTGTALNSKGESIYRIDENGQPSGTGPRFLTSQAVPPGFNATLYVVSGRGTPHQEFSLAVRPSLVSSLQFSVGGERKVTFTNILLDPK